MWAAPLGMTFAEMDRIAKLVPDDLKMTAPAAGPLTWSRT